ncbi:hypothetical protein BGZ65_007302 [Modicella reniformis]|uniref:Xylanolytic transcriptional activator regulatory domain-containing protein n=1 Tax=Modicella reniformis TaxID=1440133 RepID=A0A9P6LR55_9FUNG|nr:hypothetical protein BGZ65_007302 [Modicella reniformis]
MPSIDVIDHLIGVHFQFIHPVLPMLHSRTISEQIHQNESPPSHFLFAVLGLASRFSDNPAFRDPLPVVDRPPCTIFYERARFFIKDEYDNCQIATVQAFLLMAIQQMGFCESQRAWLYIGMAIRMAQDLGINKEPSIQEKSRNQLQCELRKRTWWSLYVVERLVPLTITHKDCEAGFPQDEDDEGDKLSNKALGTQPTYVSNFVHLIGLTRIQGDILDFIGAKFSSSSKPNSNSLYANSPSIGADQDRDHQINTSAATFTLLDKSLIEWRQNLPESLQHPTAQSPHFGLFLHLTFNTLIILLHRPQAPYSQTSASMCTQAAVTISEIVEILMDAKTLTSMFVTCLYAIFSAGIVHFMNIPSTQKSPGSSISSPMISDLKGRPLNDAMSAKTNLKRCIDALKFLANHWVSAAKRAKVLEDLLDLKHVTLKDLEVDTFKNSPVGPSWVLDSEYKDALIGPGEGQDKLRQQCRSKIMAIHSLLANDEEFKRMQRRTSLFSERDEAGDDADNTDDDSKVELPSGTKLEVEEEDIETETETRTDTLMDPVQPSSEGSMESSTPDSSWAPIALGVQSPVSSTPSSSSPTSVRIENSTTQQALESDQQGMMLSSTNPLLLNGSKRSRDDDHYYNDKDNDNNNEKPATDDKVENSPMTSIAQSSALSLSTGTAGMINNVFTSYQGAMLDPFSMPSSISFSEWNYDRGSSQSKGGVEESGNQAVSQLNTVWSTDAVTNRTTARSATSSPMIPPSGTQQDSRRVDHGNRKSGELKPSTSAKDSQPLSLYHEAITHAFPGSKLIEREDQDLVWNDMPPTLGLDEWTAYIGAMMMRWLYASGQSSPDSTASL